VIRAVDVYLRERAGDLHPRLAPRFRLMMMAFDVESGECALVVQPGTDDRDVREMLRSAHEAILTTRSESFDARRT